MTTTLEATAASISRETWRPVELLGRLVLDRHPHLPDGLVRAVLAHRPERVGRRTVGDDPEAGGRLLG
jgi:hypothetical protein